MHDFILIQLVVDPVCWSVSSKEVDPLGWSSSASRLRRIVLSLFRDFLQLVLILSLHSVICILGWLVCPKLKWRQLGFEPQPLGDEASALNRVPICVAFLLTKALTELFVNSLKLDFLAFQGQSKGKKYGEYKNEFASNFNLSISGFPFLNKTT